MKGLGRGDVGSSGNGGRFALVACAAKALCKSLASFWRCEALTGKNLYYSTFGVTARDETLMTKRNSFLWGRDAFGETGQTFLLPRGIYFPQVGDSNPTLRRGAEFPAPNRPSSLLEQPRLPVCESIYLQFYSTSRGCLLTSFTHSLSAPTYHSYSTDTLWWHPHL